MTSFFGIIFPNETEANRGLDRLRELDAKKELSLSGYAVTTKDEKGEISLKKVSHVGWTAAVEGVLLGGLAGLVAGGLGLAALGAVAGGLTGKVADKSESGDQKNFLYEVSRRLTPGSAAIIAEIEKTTEHSVDAAVATLGGIIIRS